jgi:hypothetical protein
MTKYTSWKFTLDTPAFEGLERSAVVRTMFPRDQEDAPNLDVTELMLAGLVEIAGLTEALALAREPAVEASNKPATVVLGYQAFIDDLAVYARKRMLETNERIEMPKEYEEDEDDLLDWPLARVKRLALWLGLPPEITHHDGRFTWPRELLPTSVEPV